MKKGTTRKVLSLILVAVMLLTAIPTTRLVVKAEEVQEETPREEVGDAKFFIRNEVGFIPEENGKTHYNNSLYSGPYKGTATQKAMHGTFFGNFDTSNIANVLKNEFSGVNDLIVTHPEDLNIEEGYEVVWYVSKFENDGLHFDGTIVPSQGNVVTYHANDGSDKDIVSKNAYSTNTQIQTGKYLTREMTSSQWSDIQEPTRAGYDFTGWYLDAECTEEAEETYTLENDMEFYAGWKSNQANYQVLYYYEDENGEYTLDTTLTDSNRIGTIGSIVEATTEDKDKTKDGMYEFNENHEENVLSATLEKEEESFCTQLKVYYSLTKPAGPTGPVGPTGPIGPIGPVGPTEPVEPVEPEEPTGPSTEIGDEDVPLDPNPGETENPPVDDTEEVDSSTEIEDEDTPLEEKPELKNEDELVIEEEDVPLSENPLTGDFSNNWIYAALFALFGIGVVLAKGKKKEDER